MTLIANSQVCHDILGPIRVESTSPFQHLPSVLYRIENDHVLSIVFEVDNVA